MSDSTILHVMKVMAWHRAKGELFSMLETHYGEHGNYEAFNNEIKSFIKKVEDNGLHE